MTSADNRYSIVGMNFRKSEALVAAMKAGTELTLVREPDNKFDKNAVAVWAGPVHIGYLPKTQNRAVAAYIDQQGVSWCPPAALAEDTKSPESTTVHRSVSATFVRSPNSGYPMAQIVKA